MQYFARINLIILCAAMLIAPALSLFSGLGVAPLFSVIAIGPLIFTLLQRRFSGFYRHPIMLCLWTFIAWAGLSTLWSTHPKISLLVASELVALLLGGVAILDFIRNQNDRGKKAIIVSIVAGLIISVLLAIFELFSQGMLAIYLKTALLQNPAYVYFPHDMNRGATFITLLSWVVLMALTERSSSWYVRAALFIGTLAMGLLLLSLESMAASVGFICGCGAYLCIRLLKNKGVMLIAAGLLAVVAFMPLIASHLNPPAIMERFPAIPESSQHRLYIWHYAAGIAKQSPVIGIGLRASRFILPQPSEWPRPGLNPLPSHPHNVIIQAWLELGWVGVCLYGAVLASILWALYRMKASPHRKGLAAAWIVASFIISATSYNGWQAWWIATMLLTFGLGVGLRIPPISQESQKEKQPQAREPANYSMTSQSFA
ncbi:MAG: Lipid core - O-antigen ligase [Rickettsiales bacterium]|nr:Lipid core - O-antigen ligase [Rickettsiales bacterium]